MMQRRTFIKKLGVSAGLVSVPAVASGIAASKKAKLQESTEKLSQRLENAERQIKQLKDDHKKTVKAAAIVTGILVGIDLSLIL